MIKIEFVETWGFRHAIRGMRNPLNSWERSDSYETHMENLQTHETAPYAFFVGEKDLALMQKLYNGGSEHRKYLRQIFVSMDIVAPLYWWKEFDTYKIGTTANSCSTMHKIHEKEFTLSDFSHEHLVNQVAGEYKSGVDRGNTYCARPLDVFRNTITALNKCREKFLETKSKDVWWQMIQLLPSSYNQRRTITMNYENAANIINQRKNHKLDEWRDLVEILRGLPYLADIMQEE